jgi:hypothetical protein
MKCPKCGFNSFEYYDICKKCSVDLTGYKQTYSISSLVLPQGAKAALAAEFRSNENSTAVMHIAPEMHDDIFSFDLPDVSTHSANQPASDPFNFDEPVSAVQQANNVTLEDDIFGDLLESSPRKDAPSFAPQIPAEAEPVTPSSSGTGEFDFDSFSWDETPDAQTTSGNDDTADDLDAFFDDPKEKNTK